MAFDIDMISPSQFTDRMVSNKKHLPRNLASVKSIKTNSLLLTENPVSKNRINFS